MILLPDFFQAAKGVADLLKADNGLEKNFVLVSQRWDLDVPATISFHDGWESQLMRQRGSRDGCTAHWERFLPLPRRMLHGHAGFCDRARGLGQLDDLQGAGRTMAGY